MKRYEKELTAEELAALGDEDIDLSDIPELGDDFWREARVVVPPEKKRITIRLDGDVVAYFQSQGAGYQTRMNAVLKSYVEAKKRSAS